MKKTTKKLRINLALTAEDDKKLAALMRMCTYASKHDAIRDAIRASYALMKTKGKATQSS